MKTLLTLLTILSMPVSFVCQNSLNEFEFLIGKWQGVESGVAGNGIGFRTYEYDLNKYIIIEKNISTFPKSEKKQRGEIHRDIGIISYNSNDSAIVFREYHVEGFTNIYDLNKGFSTSEKFVFISKEIENGPKSWKAKLTLNKISDTEFEETFEIASDGEIYKQLLKNNWIKVE